MTHRLVTRRTSAYALQVELPEGTDLPTALDLLAAAVPVTITDQHYDRAAGYVSVGFRASGDDQAREVALETLGGVPAAPVEVRLHTGHGVHARAVRIAQ